MQGYSCVVVGQVLKPRKEGTTLIWAEAQANMRGRCIRGHVPSTHARVIVDDEGELRLCNRAAVPRFAVRVHRQQGVLGEDRIQFDARQGEHMADCFEFLLCCKSFFTRILERARGLGEFNSSPFSWHQSLLVLMHTGWA